MEEGQRQHLLELVALGLMRLNPCCNGRGSKTNRRGDFHSCMTGLNPCCNGRGSKTMAHDYSVSKADVLILVVMEEGQRPRTRKNSGRQRKRS